MLNITMIRAAAVPSPYVNATTISFEPFNLFPKLVYVWLEITIFNFTSTNQTSRFLRRPNIRTLNNNGKSIAQTCVMVFNDLFPGSTPSCSDSCYLYKSYCVFYVRFGFMRNNSA